MFPAAARIVVVLATFFALLSGGALSAGPVAAADGDSSDQGRPAAQISKPLKPVKAMTRKQREAQVKRDEQLSVMRPALRHSKPMQQALSGTADESLDSVQTAAGKLELSAAAAPAAAEADPSFEGALWGSTYIVNDESQLDPAGVATALKANPPVSPKVYPNYRPGRTTWYVEANWTEGTNVPPVMLRMQLYRASDNQLVATRLTSRDTFSSAETTSLCRRWNADNSAPMNCVWSLRDGLLVGKVGTVYYAKLSYATQMTNHFYKVPDQTKPTYREYYLPTKWTTAVTSPGAPAIYTPGIGEGLSGQCTCWFQMLIADPVNTATGTVTETVTDAVMSGKGLPLALSRSYSSAATDTGGLLGKGWKLPFEASLTVAASTVTLTEPDGAKVEFTKQSDGTFTAPKPVRYVLAQTSSGFTVTSTDHASRVFNSSGRLTGWLDGAGQGLAFTYSDTKLTKITDAAGRETTVDVDAPTGRLNSVTLSNGRKVTYGYEAGQLARVTGTDGGVTQYTYTGGRLATVVDPRGNTVTQNTYDETTGRIRSQIDANGGKFSFTWKAATDAPAGSGESNVTDPAGGIWTDIYEAGVLMRSYRPEGGGTDRAYDQNLNATAVYDANFNKITRTFDARGNLATQETGGVTEKFVFDISDRIKSVTNGRGYSTSFEYNGSGDRVKTATGPAGTTSYTYTPNGQIETETAPRGGITRYTYTSAGLVESVTAPGGGKTSYAYDSAQRLKTETDPRGNVAGANPAAYTTSYDYDVQGRMSKVTDPERRTTSYSYDDNGNVKTVTDALGQITSYEYNKANQPTRVTGSDGKYSTMEYDVRGNQTAAVDETGRRTTFGYDGAGRRSSMTTPRGNVAGADAAKFTTTYGYDDNGSLIKSVDPTGAVTSIEYDAFDRPIKVTDPLNHITLTGYDANGNVAQVTDPLNKVTKYTYTSADLLQTVTDPLSKTTSYGYDADGNRTSETSPIGRKQTWAYNTDGLQSAQTDPRGYLTGNTASDYTTTYGYDAAGNQTSVTDPYGRRQTREYDNLGQLAASQDASGRRTTYAYDSLGRIKTVTAPDGGTTAYTYDTSGNVRTRTDDNQHTTTYGYDSAHRLTSVVDPLNRTVTHRYDADGNVDQTTNARGTVATNTYDALNRLTGSTYSDSTPATSIAYDLAGNRRQVVDATGTRTFAYDAVDRLKTVTLPTSKTFAYGYDDAGHLTSRANPDGQQTAYTYDSDGDRLTATTNSLKTTYAHAFPGLLTGVTLPNGYTETRTYDRALMLTDVVSSNSTKTLSSWHGVLDGDGRPQRVDQVRNNTGSTAAKSEYYTYDEAGRLKGDCSSATKADTCPSGSPTTAYTYDKVGNRLTQTSPTSGTTYHYDAADQLTKAVTGATTTNYAYDADGNQTTDGIDTLAYDAINRLKSKGTTAYTYDVDGNRATSVKSGTTTSYTWDINNELPLLAGESTGSVVRSYAYNELGQIESTKQPQGAFYYHHDLIGTVTDLTNSTGREIANYTFGPFGENATNLNIGAEDAPLNRFGFTGEYTDQTIRNDFDAVATSINLRARNYDPNTGRFTSRDPYVPDASTPYTQSYAYVENAPTSRTDASGMCSVTTQMKDLFTGNWGWNNNCAQEDRETATQPPAVQSAKALSDKITRGAIEASGQASLGFLDGFTFGAFTSLSGAQVTCPPMYNAGLYASMVPFPVGGGKRLALEGAEYATVSVWTRIAATQPVYANTMLPQSFNLLTAGGRQVWVHPNATKHIAEEIMYNGFSRNMKTEEMLTGLVRAVDAATAYGMQYGRRVLSHGWELIIVPAKGGVGNPVLKHARRLG
ncbi:DUF6531 domain-containing protein [Streptomyces sp. AK08-02]|uniref:DUF6531 domain-containing protein n=1 Tax=Streptomyces sp. AK08-02 TaxID=3028654 RepID=UPI0029A3E687|nr:DUF6531 domain-containing protein [Streptomyces sp. AK08-02]MDX3750613.1 DUF6531 domain-containing protein [Streptomyces sp. AK08-02]